MYNTILVPLDGSKRAEKILKYVVKLAQCFAAEVVFLQVVRPPYLVGAEMMDGAVYQKELEQRMKEAITYLKAHQEEFLEKGIASKIRVVNGPVVTSIVDCAEDEDVDLIAIASHGYSGLNRVFYGSSAAGVLNNSERPLLVIRSRED